MKKNIATLPLLSLLLCSIPFMAQAHRAWILPAATVHSSEDPWVTFDAAISNDIFHTDYHPMQTGGLQAMAPSGEMIELQNVHTGKYRSTFDLNLTERGTYKVFSASTRLTATWETDAGERVRWPGRGASATPEDFAREVPSDAKNLEITRSHQRQETFVTAGVPDDTVLEPTNVGLELVPETHPNDLFEGETARFRFLIDGEPAVGAEVTVLAGGMRYRNSQDEIMVQTDKHGLAEITWPEAGMYWMEVTYSDNTAAPPAQRRRGTYVATFEVLPF